MLVLSRRPGEQILIDGGIRLKVISVKANQVRLGIVAPSQVPVDRKEIHELRAERRCDVELVVHSDREQHQATG
jgi:carbon storage regulator